VVASSTTNVTVALSGLGAVFVPGVTAPASQYGITLSAATFVVGSMSPSAGGNYVTVALTGLASSFASGPMTAWAFPIPIIDANALLYGEAYAK
jgi:hypothetical protein